MKDHPSKLLGNLLSNPLGQTIIRLCDEQRTSCSLCIVDIHESGLDTESIRSCNVYISVWVWGFV